MNLYPRLRCAPYRRGSGSTMHKLMNLAKLSKASIRRILWRRLVCGSSRPYRPPGRPAAVPLAAVEAIEAAIEDQPVTSYREISRETGFARETIRRRLTVGRLCTILWTIRIFALFLIQIRFNGKLCLNSFA